MQSRVSLAFNAMKAIGIPPQTVKPVLKNLLKLYENNWELIEEENYRALADAIFDLEDCKRIDDNKKEVHANDESELHNKRMRLREEDEPSPSHNSGTVIDEAPLKRPKLEMVVASESHLQKERTESFLPLTYSRQKRNESLSSQFSLSENRLASGRMPKSASFEANVDTVQKDVPNHHHHTTLIKPKPELCMDDLPHFEVPIAMIRPLETSPARKEAFIGANNEEDSVPSGKSGENLQLVNIQESSQTDLQIASSVSGGIKLVITSDSALNRTGFRMPNLDDVLKRVEENYLRSYKIVQPNFSIMKVMNDFCHCVLELGTNRVNDDLTRTLDSFKKSNSKNDLGNRTRSSNGSRAFDYNRINCTQSENGNNVMDQNEKELQGLESSNLNSHSLVVYQPGQVTVDKVKPTHDVNDITKGEERIRISLVNEVSSEKFPPTFYYIPQNIVYQNAYVNFSLARIGDEDCCSDCLGNCLSSPLPCACARETGGEYAYTLEGLIKREFLDECISMLRYPEKHHHFYCKDCPLERNKNEAIPDPCKGHLVRKFIKECWSKCGCNKQCGNRVVQRGIARNLQVFLTPGGKGWGLRTLEELPRGAFVCEYVGEVLTNTELYDRNRQSTGNEKHTYPVLLDADWGSEGVLKDEEALCLDATFYGNVARFINHRCFDSNLVEIPVEVETPDRHYYHLAFFTTRKVEPLEELTWDYGIDFDDHNHPVKAFRCCCGSKFCRAMKRSKRGKLKALRSSG